VEVDERDQVAGIAEAESVDVTLSLSCVRQATLCYDRAELCN
jgi:hypothetical protein